MPVRLDTAVTQSPNCLAAEVGNELVVMSVSQGSYLALDPIARDIWDRIAVTRSAGDLCDTLAADYDAPPDIIEADVLDLLDTLVNAGMVEVAA